MAKKYHTRYYGKVGASGIELPRELIQGVGSLHSFNPIPDGWAVRVDLRLNEDAHAFAARWGLSPEPGEPDLQALMGVGKE